MARALDRTIRGIIIDTQLCFFDIQVHFQCFNTITFTLPGMGLHRDKSLHYCGSMVKINVESDSTDIDNNESLRHTLRAYEPDLNVRTSDFNLQHFSYKNFGILNLIMGHLNRTNHTGLTVSTNN